MKPIRLAVTQTNWTGDRDSMTAAQAELTAEAAAKGATIVLLQEFSIGPYFAGTTDDAGFRWSEPLRGGPSDRTFSRLASSHGITIVGSMFEVDGNGRYWDTATIHGPDGVLSHFTRKVHIPSGTGYHETHFFEGADEFPVHDLTDVRIAAPTCYDQWFPEVSRIYALEGAELVCYPTAIGAEPTDPDLDSQQAWETVMRGQAVANGVYIAAANRTGTENGVEFYGSSFICDPGGEILAKATRADTEVIVADLDPGSLERWRGLFPLLHQRRPDTYGRIMSPASGEAPRWLDGEHRNPEWAAQPEVTNDAVLDATGRGWNGWCDIIDARPDGDDDHAGIASYLEEAHSLDGWWAQTVTVGYERITGRRLPYQRPDGTFTATRSRTVAIDGSRLRAALLDTDTRRNLFGEVDTELRSNPASKTIRIDVGPGAAHIRLTDAGAGRTKVTIAHEKLPEFGDVDEWKRYWTDWLDTLEVTSLEPDG